ncbi:MAG: hypothetical protein WDN04_14750 [Rhodospirillales bacterium]
MTLRTTLLTGVAICGLTAAPALAHGGAPGIHLAAPHSGIQATAHVKSHIRNPMIQNFTETATFTGTASASAVYKQKIVLLGETWYSSTSCTAPAANKEKWVGLPKKTKFAKVGQSTSTGTIGGCGSTIFTFHDIDYTLNKKGKTVVGKTDTVNGKLVAKKFNGYNLTLVANVEITFTK